MERALVAAVFAVACAAPRPDDVGGDAPSDGSVEALASSAARRVEAFFGTRFPADYELVVLPDRAAFDASFPPEWGVPGTECWMVAFGVSDRLHVIDPAAWGTEACEHDGEDVEHVRSIVTHELVHVFHGQHNPTGDFTGMDAMGWFPEGLAVLASGQLEDARHAGSAHTAIERGVDPKRLEDGWSGEYRYGVSGSIVAYVDATWGRETLFDLLAATTEDELLDRLGIGEDELLADWRAWVLASATR